MGMENRNKKPGGEMHVQELHEQTSCSLSNGSDGGSFLGDCALCSLSRDKIPPSVVFPCVP